MLIGLLTGYGLASAFYDFDELVRKHYGEFMKETFWGGVLDRLLRAFHHYIIGMAIMMIYYNNYTLLGTIAFWFGVGIVVEEIDVLMSDLAKIKNKVVKAWRYMSGDR